MTATDMLDGLRTMWLELTVGCNLQCSHCYASSGPDQFYRDKLKKEDYSRILSEARAHGCEVVRFIGGEPAANKDLPHLLGVAKSLGYESQVFTNATILTEPLLIALKESQAQVKGSFYSFDEATHDKITGVKGSYRRTLKNLQRLLEERVPIGIGVIVMSENESHVDETLRFLSDKGFRSLDTDRVRGIGRGFEYTNKGGIDELCHRCWMGSIAVGSDGLVYPCAIGRDFLVGDVNRQSIQEIIEGKPLGDFRSSSKEKYDGSRNCCPGPIGCSPIDCEPNKICYPDCAPNICGPGA